MRLLIVLILIIGMVGLRTDPLYAEEGFICAGHHLGTSGDPAAKVMLPGSPPKMASKGSVHALTIFAGFADEPEDRIVIPSLAANLFSPDLSGSLTHFYTTMSFGQFSLTGTVLPHRFDFSEPTSFYASPGSQGEYGRYVREVLVRVDSEVDFGQYDNDGPDGIPNSGDDDGIVDYIFVLLKSVPYGFIKEGATGIAGLGFQEFQTKDHTPDGSPIMISGVMSRGSLGGIGNFAQTVGVMAHEFGHAFGLPDLYDMVYQTPEEDSAGIGAWGLMGWGAHGWTRKDGPVGFCAWSLEKLGWVGIDNKRLVEVLKPGDRLIDDLFEGGYIFKIFLPPRLHLISQSNKEQEIKAEPGYLLLEHRRRNAHYYNHHLPGEGVLVWHVQPSKVGNAFEENKLVDLVCADGLYEYEGDERRRAPLNGRDDLDCWAHDTDYAIAHNGNWGDAGDLFDGVERTELSLHSNPGISSVGDFSVEAVTPLSLRIQRQGTGMKVEIDPPRWAGEIQEEVHWAGVVIMDGDIQVKPSGSLILYWGTEIRVASEDRLHRGIDPEQSELLVQGGMAMGRSFGRNRDPIVFQEIETGESWYGLIIDPQVTAVIKIPDGALELQGASVGLVIAGVVSGGGGLLLRGLQLDDTPQGARAGNGDGQLQPGESVQLIVEVDNGLLTTYEEVRVSLHWDKDQLTPTWEDGKNQGYLTRRFDIPPGGRRRLEFPVYTLNPEAIPGEEVVIEVQLQGSREQIKIPIQPISESLPKVAVGMVGSGKIVNNQAVASADEEIPVEVEISEGEVAALELVAFSPTQRKIIDEFSLEPQPNGIFLGYVKMPEGTSVMLVPRVHSSTGSVFFAPSSLQLDVPFAQWEPVLVGGYEDQASRQLMEEVLATREIKTNFLSTSQEELWCDALLRQYMGEGKAVVWMSGRGNTSIHQALTRFLEQGGNVLVVSRSFHQNLPEELSSALGFEAIQPASLVPLYNATTGEKISQAVSHLVFNQLTSSAEPYLLDGNDQVAGLRLDDGTYRVVYLPFGLSHMESETRNQLVNESMDFLLQISHPQLSVQVLGVDPLQSQMTLQPRLLIENRGGRRSEDFQATYQILNREQVVAEFVSIQPFLDAGEVREISMPTWEPKEEADYTLNFALQDGRDQIVSPVLERHVGFVCLEGYFERVPQPADTLGNGAGFFDYDNDGDLDLYLVRLGVANKLYRNDGSEFTEVGRLARVDDGDKGRGFAIGDYDGDGDLDLYIVNQGKSKESGMNRLFRNEGDGYFEDITEELVVDKGDTEGLADSGSGRSAGFFDFDNDGDLDLYLVNAAFATTGMNRLYRNDRGHFTEVAGLVGLDDAYNGRGLAIGDYDNDGDPDLYVANHWHSKLYRNEEGNFKDVAGDMETAPPEVGALFGDYDGDGDLDLFISNESGENILWRNDGPPGDLLRTPELVHFTKDSQVDLGGHSVGSAFFDYDNDGDLDLALTGADSTGKGDQLYHNRGDGNFIEIGNLLGLRSESNGRALTWGDWDGDGMQDVLIADAQQTTFYRNRLKLASWLQIELQGVASNVHGLGARVELHADGQQQIRELQSSYGYGSQVQPWFHFGLGEVSQADSLRVIWPDGEQSIWTGIQGNQRLRLLHPQMATAVEEELSVPESFLLMENYPNPFNSETMLRFSLSTRADVDLSIFNLAGQKIMTLIKDMREAGTYTMHWIGRDDSGREMSSGIYICRLRTGQQVAIQKLVLIK